MGNYSSSSNALEQASWATGLTWLDAAAILAAFLACHFLRYRSAAGPTVWPIVGMLPQISANFKHAYDWVTLELQKSGGTFVFVVPALPSLSVAITSDPSNVEYILKTNFANFPKGVKFRAVFHDLLGSGIFNSDGPPWQHHRRISSLDLHSRAFKDMSFRCVQNLVHSRLLPLLRSVAAAERSIDFQDVMLRFTFDSICMLALGVDVGCLSVDLPQIPFATAFDLATECTFMRFMAPEFLWKIHRFFNIKKEKKLRDALAVVNNFAQDVICKRKRELSQGLNAERGDLLSRLLQSDTCKMYSDKFLRDFAINFILAGRDTTSVALTWFMWLLAQHAHVESAIFDEVSHVASINKNCNSHDLFSIHQLKNMHYLHAALCESMRLYPPVPVDNKDVLNDDILPNGTRVKKGSRVFYSIYSMGRMESIWGPDCLQFKPERWIKNGVFVPESPFKFSVFNAGPRLCLGKDLAFVQLKYVAAAIVKNFSIRLLPGHVVRKKLSLTLFMKKGLPVTLHSRPNDLKPT